MAWFGRGGNGEVFIAQLRTRRVDRRMVRTREGILHNV